LKEVAQLSDLQVLACLIGAVCHDFGHDGFTNQYQAQIKSARFQLYGEIGCQESYHFAESWKLVEETQLL
jgi:dual 3',5'-cyclic-AMP and -GMP phosphodiesterase 11